MKHEWLEEGTRVQAVGSLQASIFAVTFLRSIYVVVLTRKGGKEKREREEKERGWVGALRGGPQVIARQSGSVFFAPHTRSVSISTSPDRFASFVQLEHPLDAGSGVPAKMPSCGACGAVDSFDFDSSAGGQVCTQCGTLDPNSTSEAFVVLGRGDDDGQESGRAHLVDGGERYAGGPAQIKGRGIAGSGGREVYYAQKLVSPPRGASLLFP